MWRDNNPVLYFSLLPSFSPPDSWSELCLSISRYAAQIPVSHRSQPLLMSRLENLLQKVRLNDSRMKIPGSKLCATRWTHEDNDLDPASSPIPWDDVLVICIDHKLKDWQIPGPPVCEGGDSFLFFCFFLHRSMSILLGEPAQNVCFVV